GEVVEVGRAVEGFQPKDRVVVEPQKTCGTCIYCQGSDYYLCKQKVVLGTTTWNGAFGEYIVAPERIVYPLPDNMSYEEGALVEPLAVGLHAVRQSGVQLGSSVVVIGSGTIGLATMACAQAQGAGQIIASDVLDFNLKMAKKMGATRVVNVRREKLPEVVAKEIHPSGAEIGFDAAGYPSVVDDLLSVIRRKGEIVLIALFEEAVVIKNSFGIIGGEMKIKGVQMYHRDDFQAAIDLIRLGRIDVKPLVSHRLPVEEAQKGLEILYRKSEEVIKVLLIYP
ncbi:MAG: zinc-binding dehydrogenase, partial [candidate division NC10 bacterium]|nr:zinc-binding dehydrogenase [candidate division NC10 bacterium]